MSTIIRPSREQIRSLIQSFSATDPLSSLYKNLALDLVDKASDPTDRTDYVNGHFTAQAIVINKELNSIAIMENIRLGGLVTCFGGHVEPGDADMVQTAKREAREEGGLTKIFLLEAAPLDLDFYPCPEKGNEPDHGHIDIRFLFSTEETELKKNHESKSVKWVKVSAFRQAFKWWPSNTRLIRALEARFG